jgi:thiamine kinase-like enzyme
MLQTPKVGNNLSFLIEHGRLHCQVGFNMIVRLAIPFIQGLFECNLESNMLHNDVSLLNVCLDEIEGRLFLIDFEKLAERKSKSVNSDIAAFFRGVIMDLAFLANVEQRRYLERVRRISVDDLTLERLVTILQNTLRLESLEEELERIERTQDEIRRIESASQ